LKFKTKEDLLNKKYGVQKYNPSTLEPETNIEADGYMKALDDTFESFKERIEFYKKYSVAGGNFRNDFPEEYKKFDKILNERNITNPIANNCMWLHWLFDYCFGDI